MTANPGEFAVCVGRAKELLGSAERKPTDREKEEAPRREPLLVIAALMFA
jgi:hypothetical protein